MIDAILTNTLPPELSRNVPKRMMDGEPISKVTVNASPGGFSYAVE